MEFIKNIDPTFKKDILFIKRYYKQNYKNLQKCNKLYDKMVQKLSYFPNIEKDIYFESIRKTLEKEFENYRYYMKMFMCSY